MCAPRLIVVRKDRDMLARKMYCEFRLEVARAAIVASGGHAETLKGENVLLALADSYGLCRGELVQTEGHAAHIAEAPNPSAAAIRSALLELFTVIAHDLIEQFPGGVRVVVKRLNVALL